MLKYKKFRTFSLVMAESFDAWRIMPRLVLIAYSILVMHLYLWYKTIPTYVQERCDAAVLQIFLNNKTPIDEAQKIACTVQDVVGGPTPAQTTLVTTIMGLATLIFGFYTNSGRKWEKGMPDDVKDFPVANIITNSHPQIKQNKAIPKNDDETIIGPNGPIS